MTRVRCSFSDLLGPVERSNSSSLSLLPGMASYLVPWAVNSFRQPLLHFHLNLPNPLNFATWPFSTGAWHMTTSTWTWHRPAWCLVPWQRNRCEDLTGGQIQGETFLEQPMLHGPSKGILGFHDPRGRRPIAYTVVKSALLKSVPRRGMRMVALKIIYDYVILHLSTTKKDDELTGDGRTWIRC